MSTKKPACPRVQLMWLSDDEVLEAWVHVAQDPETLSVSIEKAVGSAESPEWAVFAYEGFGPLEPRGNKPDIEDLSRTAFFIKERNEAFRSLVSYFTDLDQEEPAVFDDFLRKSRVTSDNELLAYFEKAVRLRPVAFEETEEDMIPW